MPEDVLLIAAVMMVVVVVVVVVVVRIFHAVDWLMLVVLAALVAFRVRMKTSCSFIVFLLNNKSFDGDGIWWWLLL